MISRPLRWTLIGIAAALVIGVGAWAAWGLIDGAQDDEEVAQRLRSALASVSPLEAHPLPSGFASSNGRTEAKQLIVATRQPGKLETVLAEEGDYVSAGQELARLETRDLEAALVEARAEVRRAEEHREYVRALLRQRQAELDYARKTLDRMRRLHEANAVSQDEVDEAETAQQVSAAAVSAAREQLVEANAAIDVARSRVDQAQIQLDYSRITAPRDGRIQHRLAEPGEVLPVGGPVYAMLDLDDTYMTFFLPTEEAGRVALGAEARIVLDAFPDRPIPARISFVADEAQFTPKFVETQRERQKLSFRLKARVQVPEQYRDLAKPGMPGVCYVRLDQEAQWPKWLKTDPL